MNFLDALKKEVVENVTYNQSITENGAIGYKTTGKSILDMNFKVSSYRNCSEQEIIKDFQKVLNEDSDIALVWLFFVRDVRQGLGERRLFRICFKKYLKGCIPDSRLEKLLKLVNEYGRWDDLVDLLGIDKKIDEMIFGIVRDQLESDMKNKIEGKPISLLAKWLPSSGVKRQERKIQRVALVKGLKLEKSTYQKILSNLRAYLEVVETKMSSNNWTEINYEHVPSRANLIYKNAFINHDGERYQQYLDAVEKGEAKINAGTLFPHDIVAKYTIEGNRCSVGPRDSQLESLWKNLPNTVKEGQSTLVVRDGSGSMTTKVSGNISCLTVATALAIYFSERLTGPYKDNFITFSSRPQLIDLSKCKSLKEKLEVCYDYDDCTNTNIEKTFDLILDTAVKNKLTQEEIPANVLILSDLEFDQATFNYGLNDGTPKVDKALFQEIEEKFNQAGYKLPRLVFWNINSRTKTIPVIQNDLGVALVSGFSQNNAKMVMSGELDPYKCLLETLDSERYKPIRDILDE